MTDTSPEALDALIAGLHDAARSIEFDSDRNLMTAAADTIAALRAAPVAMRERAAEQSAMVCRQVIDGWVKSGDSRDHERNGEIAAGQCLRFVPSAIRALPLDTPAPVDPVAEAAKRVRKFITEWGRLTMRDGDIQALHVNTEREAMLTVADLELLVAAQEARHE
jgi:hypothetical protein